MEDKLNNKVLIIVGPTAVGKSDFAINLAKLFNAEIISADSQQVYKELNIGTAKVMPEEMQGIPHYLIDVRELSENYSAHDFVKEAEQKIAEIQSRDKLPIIVGGTGLYIQSLTEGYHLGGEENHQKMQALRAELELLSDEDLRSRVHLQEFNRRRAIRKIELETFGTGENQGPKHDYLIIGLNRLPREELYQRINYRVDLMMKAGLLPEAKKLFEEYPEVQAAKGIGYKELFPYFSGEISLDEAVELIKRNSRRYAKRQLTWFKNRMNVKFYNVSETAFPENAIIDIKDFLKN